MENKETANDEVAKQNVADSGRGIRKNHARCDRNLKIGTMIEYAGLSYQYYGPLGKPASWGPYDVDVEE